MLKILLAIEHPDQTLLTSLDGHRLDRISSEEIPSDLLSKGSYDLMVTDRPKEDLPRLKGCDPRVEIIVLGHQQEEALEAITLGATDFLTRPIDPGRMKEVIEKIEGIVEMRRETAQLEKLLSAKYLFAGIVGRNPQILEIISFIRRIAPYFRVVLITGETGTGKEVVARALHATSPMAKHPFAVYNCGAVVENLIETELFGHTKGSFTGAIRDKIGLFEAAGEGTLFLDEIGELPLSFQPHLLRVLHNGEYRKVGSHLPSRARCRIIAATNRTLEAEVTDGRFREDLYFRITPLVIRVPPLRERKDDLPLLCRALLNQFSQRTGKKVLGISRPAQAALMAYHWPGNIRELENVLEQAAILTTESFLRMQDLPPSLIRPVPQQSHLLPRTLQESEKLHIEAVLQQSKGNRSKTARLLGLSRRSLLRRMKKHGLG